MQVAGTEDVKVQGKRMDIFSVGGSHDAGKEDDKVQGKIIAMQGKRTAKLRGRGWQCLG